jgi:hypothetical protein
LLPSGGLNNFAGTFTVANTEMTNLFTPGATVATITISTVPEPASGLLMSVAQQIEVHLDACAICKNFVKSLADSSELADA